MLDFVYWHFIWQNDVRGSIREESDSVSAILFLAATKGNNLNLANALHDVCQAQKIESEVLSLEDFMMPLYTPTNEQAGLPENAAKLAAHMKAARAIVWLAPEYNGSLPPIVINAIAWLSRVSRDWRENFNGKFMVVGTHSGGGGNSVVLALREQLQFLGAIVMPRMIVTTSQKALNSDSARDILIQLDKLTR